MTETTLNTSLSYNSNSGNVGYYENGTWYPWNWDYYTHYYPTPIYCYHTDKPNSFELSFKIVSKLMEKNIIEDITIKKFIELINEIAKLI